MGSAAQRHWAGGKRCGDPKNACAFFSAAIGVYWQRIAARPFQSRRVGTAGTQIVHVGNTQAARGKGGRAAGCGGSHGCCGAWAGG